MRQDIASVPLARCAAVKKLAIKPANPVRICSGKLPGAMRRENPGPCAGRSQSLCRAGVRHSRRTKLLFLAAGELRKVATVQASSVLLTIALLANRGDRRLLGGRRRC